MSGNCYLEIATTRFTLLLCCIRIAQALYACVYVRLAYYYVAVHPSIIREQVLTALRREYCFPVRPGGGRACIYPRAVVPPFQPICILVQQFHETSRASTRSHDDILVRLDGARQFARCFLLRGSYRHEDDTVWVFFLLFAVIDYNVFLGIYFQDASEYIGTRDIYFHAVFIQIMRRQRLVAMMYNSGIFEMRRDPGRYGSILRFRFDMRVVLRSASLRIITVNRASYRHALR